MNEIKPTTGTSLVKRGLAEMLKGGVIMDVVTPEQAKIAEDAGAVAVMALERVPADIRAQGGVARMSDPDMIDGIIKAVSIPVMAKARIGHFVEAQIIQSLGVDYIDESEVLSPADLGLVITHSKLSPEICDVRHWDSQRPIATVMYPLGRRWPLEISPNHHLNQSAQPTKT